MIRLLAHVGRRQVPATVVPFTDDGSTVIVEMDQTTLRGISAAVEVAFGDEVPDEYREVASELWDFFVKHRTNGGDHV